MVSVDLLWQDSLDRHVFNYQQFFRGGSPVKSCWNSWKMLKVRPDIASISAKLSVFISVVMILDTKTIFETEAILIWYLIDQIFFLM